MKTIESKTKPTGRYRRFECQTCGHRLSRGGNNAEVEVKSNMRRPGTRKRMFDNDQVREIRRSMDSRRALAERYGCSVEMIRAIRAGLLYRDMLPDGYRPPPGPNDPSCEQCSEWLGPDAVHPCRFGFPDPIEEGPGFARDCQMFAVEG